MGNYSHKILNGVDEGFKLHLKTKEFIMTKAIPVILFSVLTTTVFASTSYEVYLNNIPTSGTHTEILQTGWYRINNSRFNWTNPTNQVKQKIIIEMNEKLKSEGRLKLESVLEFETSKTCETVKEYTKEQISIIQDTNSSKYESGSGYSGNALAATGYSSSGVVANQIAQASVSGNSYSSGSIYKNHYLYNKTTRDIYCAKTGIYLRAKLKLTSQLAQYANSDFIRYSVDRHIDQTIEGLSNSIKVFLDGLNQIEQSPVIRPDRFSFFNIERGSEMSSWFTFYLAQLKMSIDYMDYLENLKFGFSVNSKIQSLRFAVIEALAKLRRFESPGIYVLIIDNETSQVSPLQLFDEVMLSSVPAFSKILAAFSEQKSKSDIRIRNYSIVVKGDLRRSVEQKLSDASRAEEKLEKCRSHLWQLSNLDFKELHENPGGQNQQVREFLSVCGGLYRKKTTTSVNSSNPREWENSVSSEMYRILKSGCMVVDIDAKDDVSIFQSICRK